MVVDQKPPSDEPTSDAPSGADQEDQFDLSQAMQDLRDDVAGLRVGFTRLRAEIATVRGLVIDLSAEPAGPSEADLRDLQDEMRLLRRRIGLRASGANAQLDDSALARLADLIHEKLTQRATPLPRSRWRRTRKG